VGKMDKKLALTYTPICVGKMDKFLVLTKPRINKDKNR